MLGGSYLSIDDLRYIVTTDGNPLSGQDLEEFLQEADIFKNGVVVRNRLSRVDIVALLRAACLTGTRSTAGLQGFRGVVAERGRAMN